MMLYTPEELGDDDYFPWFLENYSEPQYAQYQDEAEPLAVVALRERIFGYLASHGEIDSDDEEDDHCVMATLPLTRLWTLQLYAGENAVQGKKTNSYFTAVRVWPSEENPHYSNDGVLMVILEETTALNGFEHRPLTAPEIAGLSLDIETALSVHEAFLTVEGRLPPI